MLSLLEKQILLTIAYSAYFSFPLSSQEIEQRLIWTKHLKKVTSAMIKKSLKKLVFNNQLRKIQSYYCLASRVEVLDFFIDEQKHRSQIIQDFFNDLEKFLFFAKKLIFIQAVALTGGLAIKNVKKGDDIDLLIITKGERLWITRFYCLIWSFFHGERKKFCFNIWLEENSLTITDDHQNLFTAYESCQIQWLLDRANIQEKFYSNNIWIKNFLPIFYEQLLRKKKSAKARFKVKNSNYLFNIVWKLKYLQNLLNLTMNFLNRVLFYIEIAYLKIKISFDKISFSFNQAFLHQDDKSLGIKQYLEEFVKKKYEDY